MWPRKGKKNIIARFVMREVWKFLLSGLRQSRWYLHEKEGRAFEQLVYKLLLK